MLPKFCYILFSKETMTGKMSAHVRALVFKFLFDLWSLEPVNIKESMHTGAWLYV